MLFNLGTWTSRLCEAENGTGNGFVELADGISFLLLSDFTSKLMRA